MGDYSTGELLFRLVCLLVSTSVESFNWTAQPTNPTPAIKGQDVSLAWQYSLTADELSKSQSEYYIKFRKKLNQSNYDEIGSKSFLQFIGTIVYGEPQGPRIVIDRSDQATLIIKDVRKEDEGTYKIEFFLESDGIVLGEHRVNVTVLERPELDYASNNQDVCEDSMVTLFCNATGKPAPNINWTRVWENGTDGEQLPVVDGSYVMSNIKRSSNGTYRCTAYNGAGDPVNRTVNVIVRYSAAIVRVVKSTETVIVRDTFSINCEASGDPMPNVTWIRVSDDEPSNGNILNFTNITRGDSGDYICETKNRCGNESRSESVNVFYQPGMVTLETNTTENHDCSDLWVNFTCISSEANPPVYNYLLSDEKNGISFSKSGTWIKKISRGGKSIYNCTAYQLVGNVTSTNNITLTVNVPASVEQIENINVTEGKNVQEYCNVTAGFPRPTVMWTNVKTGEHIKENPLNITNINRTQAGEYRCTANNTCAEASTVMNINVQYQPENARLITNTTSKVCTGDAINFTCTAEANPAVHTYLLYENDTVAKSMGILGNWIKSLENPGKFVFRCEAINSIQGIGKSGNTTLTVDVPTAVENIENKVVKEEGDNVRVYCNVTAGIPDPTVMWTKVTSGEHIKGNPLNITNINRAQAGEYKCTANNTCGVDSTVVDIDVHYQPENVRLITNTSSKVCTRVVINFTCTAEANPAVHTYLLYENDSVVKSMGISGTWIKSLEIPGKFVFRCEANNSIQGIGKSGNTILTVDVPAAVENIENKVVKEEGDNVRVYCNVTAGIPDPTVMWTKVTSGEHIKGNPLNITNISRAQAGKYRCTANNTCGVDSTVVDIDVQYPPVDRRGYTIDVLEGHSTKINCEVHGNPPPNVTWYKGNDTSGTMINTNGTLVFTETVFNDSGWYTCFAENVLGNGSVTVYLRVGNPSTPITSTEPMTEDPRNKASDVLGSMKVTNVPFKKEFTDMSSEDSKNLATRCKNAFREVYKRTDGFKDVYNDTRVIKFEEGSVVVFFTIIFNDVVPIDEAILVLKNASENRNIGDLEVEAESIETLQQFPTSSVTSSPTATTSATPDHDTKLWIIIGASAGGAIVLVVIVVVAWCVHHKRKCRRKGSKVRCSESEEQAFTPREDNDPGHVNNGYAEAGPRPTAMADMSQHQGASVAPTYAVVDKSAKKGNMKDKKDEEKKPQTEPPQYSVVDKSKKKKKKKEEEPEATYAQVDMSKKSKKKAKLGEVLYADLGDFHQMQELPNVSTSPKALPPIKKPAPYVETQYADITQFLKGDVTLPDSEKSQGPAPGTQPAPVPENQEGQEPGTSAKETSQASNPGGDGGPDHETNF